MSLSALTSGRENPEGRRCHSGSASSRGTKMWPLHCCQMTRPECTKGKAKDRNRYLLMVILLACTASLILCVIYMLLLRLRIRPAWFSGAHISFDPDHLTIFGPSVTHDARSESGQLHSTYFHHHFDCVRVCLVENSVELISLCSSGIYVSIFETGCMPYN